MKIVSLIASATEIVNALGFGGDLVGRSHECDFPPAVRELPELTGPKFPTDRPSAEIDRQVKDLLSLSLSVYKVDAERLRAVRPDVIVTQVQCEVCAVSLKDVEEAVCAWVESRPRIVALNPNALEDIWADIRKVAAALGAPGRGDELVQRLQARMAAVVAAVPAGSRPRVASVEWIEPLMSAGNWHPTLVEMAGGVNLFGEAGKHSPWMKWDELVAADPDVIVIAPCGFDIARTRQELQGREEWRSLRGRVVLADGNAYFNRPGPRVVESLEILAEILHPSHFRSGHEGTGWQPL